MGRQRQRGWIEEKRGIRPLFNWLVCSNKVKHPIAIGNGFFFSFILLFYYSYYSSALFNSRAVYWRNRAVYHTHTRKWPLLHWVGLTIIFYDSQSGWKNLLNIYIGVFILFFIFAHFLTSLLRNKWPENHQSGKWIIAFQVENMGSIRFEFVNKFSLLL